jgi:DNA-binding NtrC family response regulator
MPPKRILVVEDDVSILRLVATVLRRENYDVDTASGGKDAISKIEQLTRYNVVVLDLMMAAVSGLDVLKKVAVRYPQIKCVVIMSAASSRVVTNSITPNVFAVLPKPFEIGELIKVVAGCIEAARQPAEPPDNLEPVPKAA